jgi:hypothetical protein
MKSSTNIIACVLGKNMLAIELPCKLQNGTTIFFFTNFKFKKIFQNFGTRLYKDAIDRPKSNFIRECHMHH